MQAGGAARREVDRHWMSRALALARRGEGRVSPNPLVGAVIVRDGVEVGEGAHRRFGGAHAEAAALARSGAQARGSTAYVSLEPCNHHGRTPPCVDALIAAGVRRVVAAMRDPNPAVAGGGLAVLARHGVATTCGVREEEARELNASFLRHVTRGVPYVRWKCAASLDGRIATRGGESRWISGAAARVHAHRLRYWSDAVLVGIGTVLKDDPELTVRLAGKGDKRIVRVVLDAGLRIPPAARLLAATGGPVVVYCAAGASDRRRRAIAARGGVVVTVPFGRGGGLSLRHVLADLGRRGIGRLLIEGGGQVAASFWSEGLVDAVTWVTAPLVLGADGVAAVGPLGIERLSAASRLELVSVRRMGEDVVLECRTARKAD